MKNKIFTLALISISLMILLSANVSAEMWYWNTININYDDQTITQYGYYQFDDTSGQGVGRNKPIEVILWYEVEGLPYDLSVGNHSGYVDWCNFTATHLMNKYGTSFIAWEGLVGGEFINTTEEVDNIYFENTTTFSNGQFSYDMKDKDGLTIAMECHYTNASSLYVENILFGRFTTYFGAYECDDFQEYSLEELSNSVERNDEIIAEQTEVYGKIQYIIGRNFFLWLMASWLVKIGFLIMAVTLVFAGIYYLYMFLKDIEGQI